MLRQVLHAIVAVLLWVLFGYYWWIVLRQPMNPDTQMALTILAILTLASILYITFWILHNIRIYRTQHRRKERRKVELETGRDYLGRRIVIDDPYALLKSNYIEIDVKRSFVSGEPVEWKVFKTRERAG